MRSLNSPWIIIIILSIVTTVYQNAFQIILSGMNKMWSYQPNKNNMRINMSNDDRLNQFTIQTQSAHIHTTHKNDVDH